MILQLALHWSRKLALIKLYVRIDTREAPIANTRLKYINQIIWIKLYYNIMYYVKYFLIGRSSKTSNLNLNMGLVFVKTEKSRKHEEKTINTQIIVQWSSCHIRLGIRMICPDSSSTSMTIELWRCDHWHQFIVGRCDAI